MERFVYLNGSFFDRVSNTAEEMARSLGAKIEKVVPRHSITMGDCEDVYLVKEDEPVKPVCPTCGEKMKQIGHNEAFMTCFCPNHGERVFPLLAKDLLLDDIRERLMSDPTTKARLKEALERVSMSGTGDVSLTDGISLRNWVIEVYKLPVDYFDDVLIKDLAALGREILAS